MSIYKRWWFVCPIALAIVFMFVVSACMAADMVFADPSPASAVAAAPAEPAVPVPCPEAPKEKGPPLPFHTIEGYGGGAITPMAYLINPGPDDRIFGKPGFAMSYVNLGKKNLEAITVTETLWGRVELGYGGDRFGLGTLPMAIRDATVSPTNPTGIDIEHSDLWLHTFNVRTLLVKENSCFGDIALPAITFGVHLKYNDGIDSVNQHLGGVLTGIGYRRSNGEEFTLTATKTIPPEVLGRPVIASVGLRESNAANLGFLGFSDHYNATVEANVACLVTDKILFAYEFRQKTDPYGTIPGLINGEDNWHAVDAAYILSNHATLVAGWGNFGTLANSEANGAWWLQLKYEF